MSSAFKIDKTKKSLPSRGIYTSVKNWTRQKAERDSMLWGNQQKLWIIENKVYDLRKYSHSHPGGKQWIQITKGQEITEQFITHHLNEEKARAVLNKYFVKEADKPQRARFTFEEDGLYRKIKKRLLESYRSELLQNWEKSISNGIIFLFMWIILFVACSVYSSYSFAILCGLSIYPLIGVAHNFVHMKFHPFRYLYLLTGFTHVEWEEMHCLSHHSYSNTLLDYEIQGLEPFVYYLRVHPKNTVIGGIIKQIIFPFATLLSMTLRLFILPLMHKQRPDWLYLAPLLQIPAIYLLNGNIEVSVSLFFTIHVAFSTIFMKINFFGHRTGRQWTEGNEEIRDFAEHQIAACTDVTTNNLCGFLSFAIYAGFNFHAIHHLFPTIDNHSLPLANKILVEQAGKVGIKKNEIPSWVVGLYEIQCNFFNRKEWKR